jgi:hypothetical protein
VVRIVCAELAVSDPVEPARPAPAPVNGVSVSEVPVVLSVFDAPAGPVIVSTLALLPLPTAALMPSPLYVASALICCASALNVVPAATVSVCADPEASVSDNVPATRSVLAASVSVDVAPAPVVGVVGADGANALDATAVDTVLNSNYPDVVGFLQNSGSFGFNLTSTLNNLADTGPYGSLYLQVQQNSQQESTLNADISTENVLISADQSSLTTELNTANEELQAIPTQLQEINEVYSAVTGYNQNTG